MKHLCILFILLVGQFLRIHAQDVFTIAEAVLSPTGYHTQPLFIEDEQRGYFTAFKTNLSNNNYANMYIQRLNQYGEPMYQQGGVRVCPTQSNQNNAHLTPDGKGGVFVVWEDMRGGLTEPRIFAQHLNEFGEPLWKKEGISVTTRVGKQQNPKVIQDNKGGIFIFWEDFRNKSNEVDIYYQRLSANGAPIWEVEGKKLISTLGKQKTIQLLPANDKGTIVIWEDYRYRNYTALFGQLLDAEGEVKWATNGQSIAQRADAHVKNAAICQNGFGGIVAIFEVIGPSSNGKDLFVSHFAEGGFAVFERPVCELSQDQTNPGIVYKGADVVLFWEDYRDNNGDIYAQRMDISNGRFLWNESGAPICTQPDDQKNPHLVSSSLRGDQIFSWSDFRYGNSDVYAQKIDKFGESIWAFGGTPVCTLTTPQTLLLSAPDHKGGAFFLWIDDLSNSLTQVSIAAIEKDGVLSFGKEPKPLASSKRTEFVKIDNIRMEEGTSNDFFIVWEDYRNGQKNPDIYMQRGNKDGRMLWRSGGTPVCEAEGIQTISKLIVLPEGILIGWLDRRNNDDDLYLQLIDTSGKIVWQRDGIPLCDAPKTQNNLQLLRTKDRKIFALWTDARDFYETGFDIYCQLLNMHGRALWGTNGKQFIKTTHYELSPTIVADDNEGIYAAWMDERRGNYHIFAQYIDHKGNKQWGDGICLSAGKGHQRFPAICKDAAGSIYVSWADDRNGWEHTQIFMQKLNIVGDRLWNNSGKVACGNADRQTFQNIISDFTKGVIVTWLDQRDHYNSGYNLYTQRIDPRGEPLWVESGVLVGKNLRENAPYDVLVRNNGDVYFTWQQKNKTGENNIYISIVQHTDGKVLTKERIISPKGAEAILPKLANMSDGSVMLTWLEIITQHLDYKLKGLLLTEDSKSIKQN